MNEEHALD